LAQHDISVVASVLQLSGSNWISYSS